MKLIAFLLTILFVTSCNIKINLEYHHMSYHALDMTYEEALAKKDSIHKKYPSFLIDHKDVNEWTNDKDRKIYQSYFYIAETNQVALCVFYVKWKIIVL